MTEKQFAKYAGKRIRVTWHQFPYSVALNTCEGVLETNPYKVFSTKTKTEKTRIDFRVVSDDETISLHWNQMKLIVKVEEIK